MHQSYAVSMSSVYKDRANNLFFFRVEALCLIFLQGTSKLWVLL